MQRHPSGCDPQAFRSRQFLKISRENAGTRKPCDPVLEKLPGMQTALGELERSGPSLYRGTIEKSNLNRLANDLAEILVRHVNRIRFQARIAAQTSQEHVNVNHEEPHVPRKRARSLRYIEESDQTGRSFRNPPGRPRRGHESHESNDLSRGVSHPQDVDRVRPQRKRRMLRYAYSEEEDDDVQEVRMERPRRSKEIRENLNDEMAYEYMEKAARQKEEESRRQQESLEAEKQNITVIDDSTDDDDEQGFIPKVVCPKQYVRERALESDFASLTPIITDSDDDTDTEYARKWNARRTKKSIHDSNKAHLVEKQCLVFPLGRKARLVRDFVVDVELMRNLAREGLHHKNHRSILQALPRIPQEHLEPGGRHWTNFEITEGFRQGSSETLFFDYLMKQQQAQVIPNKTTSLPKKAAYGNNIHVEQRKYTPRPPDIGHRSGDLSGIKETIHPVEAVNVDPEVSSSQFGSRQQAGRNDAQSRKLNGLNQTPKEANLLLKQREQQRIRAELSEARTGKSTTTGPLAADISAKRAQSYQQVRPIPAMKQVVGRDANHMTRNNLSNTTQRIDGDQAQATTDPSVLCAMRSIAYQQNVTMPHNHLTAVSSNEAGSYQVHAQYQQPVYYPTQQQQQIQSVPTHQQSHTIAQVPPGQRYLLQGGSQRLPSTEEIQAYQLMLQRGLVTSSPNPQLLQIQAYQEWQRQVRMQSLQQQQMLRRQIQQRQQLVMPRPAHSQTPQNGQRVADHQVGRQFGNQSYAVRERYDQRVQATERGKSANIDAMRSSGTGNGTPGTPMPSHSSEANTMRQESKLIAPATQTGSLGPQNRQAVKATNPSISGNRTPSLKSNKLSNPSNALTMPDSNANLNPIIEDDGSDKWDKPEKQPSQQALRNPRRMTSEASRSAPTRRTTAEVQLVRSQPQALPTSAVRGVPTWQWDRLNYLPLAVAQSNGLNTAQSHQTRPRATDADRNGVQNAQGSFGDHERQYQEAYQAQYELQLRKVMEEIRKKRGGSGAGRG